MNIIRKQSSKGFTLIELLVVVAIIAILAAAAVPSLLTAQTRSKVARAKADLRTLAAAVETYTVDHNLPPLDYSVFRGDFMGPGMGQQTSGILHPGYADPAALNGVRIGLTTPIAYIANCWLDDPFVKGSSIAEVPFDQQKYTYNWFEPSPLRGVNARAEYLFQEYDKHYGFWRLGSVGPDRDFYNTAQPNATQIYAASRVYDATNGSLSNGNIWRSHKSAEGLQRPPFDDIIDP